MTASHKISSAVVRADFNDLTAVIHYTRAAHELGLWKSERVLIERHFPDRAAPLIEAGCGAGRVTLGLWSLGYRNLTAFDFADELLDQACSLAAERGADRGAESIRFLHADATRLVAQLASGNPIGYRTRPRPDHRGTRGGTDSAGADGANGQHGSIPGGFRGALFMFNGLMQIPGRAHRRTALRQLHDVCVPGAPLVFTTHDRDASPAERLLWRLETQRWMRGEQDPRLVEFGDRYFEEEGTGRTFMHLPTRDEVLGDLAATGWAHHFDAMRPDLAKESAAVLAFSDECRFWVAHRTP